ncbi:MAG: hypothetical protein CVT95_03990 [Bacteroidetes bacterium HGW-Bacteroidetes-12]|nr:MAG: hypothetical protein CVT95_03990 [Bacteroidetes bacterium HGW-Bacteroidetes-12]
MSTILQYLVNVLLATAMHLGLLVVPIILLGFAMHFISKQMEQLTCKIIGKQGYLYLFGWLGTAVHEVGHLVFALIFGHHISNVKLFSLNANNPELGFVKHSFNKKNIYQNIGNFFIGIGPILLGGSSLFIVSYFLFNININDLNISSLKINYLSFSSDIKATFYAVYDVLMNFLKTILQNNNEAWWKYLLFFYLLFAIGSSISLSKSDIKGSLQGLLLFISLILLFNLSTYWIGNFATTIFAFIAQLMTSFYLVLLISIVFNLGFLLFLWIITLFIPTKIEKKKIK